MFGAISVAVATLAQVGPAALAPQVAMDHIALELTIDYEEGTIAGKATLTIVNRGSAPVSVIPLQLGRLLRVNEIVADRGAVRFTQEVVSYTDWPNYQINQIDIDLDRALPPSASIRIAVTYEGYLVPYTETGMLYVRDHVDRDFTILRVEALAFPMLGVPSRRETRAMSRLDFTFGLAITVPSDQVVAAAIEPSARVESGETVTWKFESQVPVPFLNIPIAPYAILRRGDVRIFHFLEDSAGAGMLMRGIEGALELYSHWFGPIDRDAAITIMEIPEGFGSQASLRAGVIQTADAFQNQSGLTAVYHELAHFWHPRDTGTPAVRWNEGLATFLQNRVAAVQDSGRPLAEVMEARATRLVSQLADDAERASVPMIEYGNRQLTGLSYSTGALMLYALYRTLGEARFDAVMGEYFRAYRSTGSDTDEFVRFIQSNTANNLATLFKDWVYTTNWLARLESGEVLEAIVSSY